MRDSGVDADGVVLGAVEGRPFRVAYKVHCDTGWRMRVVRLGLPGEAPKVELLSDGEGNRSTYNGQAIEYLEGCEYVDIAETPFTNTLPIRRLGLVPGESADFFVAYFDAAELQPWPEPQRYTCLEKFPAGADRVRVYLLFEDSVYDHRLTTSLAPTHAKLVRRAKRLPARSG